MLSGDYLSKVRAQYERYPFPQRDPEAERRRLIVTPMELLERINHYCFAGKRRWTGFRALVVGAGTGDQVIFLAHQLRGVNAEVVYLDISRSALNIARKRARVRGLTNIRWVHGSLLDLPKMKLGRFDYVSAYGVMHHLADPVRGLRCVRNVLKADGAVGVMVYGKYGRTGIYQVQHLMQIINAGERSQAKRVANTKVVLGSLPSTNGFKRCETPGDDHRMFGDSGWYDMFLHEQDRAYTVPEVYELAHRARLRLLTFTAVKQSHGKMAYRPETFVRDRRLLKKIGRLPLVLQQAVAENIVGSLDNHACYLARTPSPIPDPAELEYVPFFSNFRVDTSRIAHLMAEHPLSTVVVSQPTSQVSLSSSEASRRLFKYLDGTRTVGEIIEAAHQETGPKIFRSALLKNFRVIFSLFHDCEWMYLRKGSTELFETFGEAEIAARFHAVGWT